ncbi:MAG: EthD domain-containing protein [Nocardia sp.]|nr:EthD domain-containing protein [Nocardia sp.]
MIKRLRFAVRRDTVTIEEFIHEYPLLCGAAEDAPGDVRPVRMTVNTVVPELAEPDCAHDGVSVEWFRDQEHMNRHDGWCQAQPRIPDAVTDAEPTAEVIAHEHVLRGEQWLADRWTSGGDRLKHMALAIRADGLTADEFTARWRSHAGTVGGPAPVPIPPPARGNAYAQNHPIPEATSTYDAVNEVWFDDLPGLKGRIDWFRDNFRNEPTDLFRRSWFLAVRETIVIS